MYDLWLKCRMTPRIHPVLSSAELASDCDQGASGSAVERGLEKLYLVLPKDVYVEDISCSPSVFS